MPRHPRPDAWRDTGSGGDSDPARGSDPTGRSDQAGQGIVEYGLILSLSTLLAVILLAFFGPTMSFVLKAVGDAIDAAS